MKTLLIGLGGVLAVALIIGAILLAWLIYTFVFVDSRGERAVDGLDEYKTLLEGVSVTESAYKGPDLIRDYGRVSTRGKEWLLQPDGSIQAGMRVMDGDPAVEVTRLPMLIPSEPAVPPGEVKFGYVEDWLAEDRDDLPEPSADAPALIFNGNKVRAAEHSRIADELAELPAQTLEWVS